MGSEAAQSLRLYFLAYQQKERIAGHDCGSRIAWRHFKPYHGLFLYKDIEYALDKGWLAIVPNVNMEPKDPGALLTTCQNEGNAS